MQAYSTQVLKCMNCMLASLGIPKKLTALYHITPELVTALAEAHYRRRIHDMIWFLEDRLKKDLGVEKQEQLLGHLRNDEFKRADLFTVLSVAEIVYSVQRSGQLPPFPEMNEKVCELLQRKRDTMVAHGSFLRSQLLQTGGSDCARENLQKTEISEFKPPYLPDDEVLALKRDLFERYLMPIIEKYYMHYQSENEIKFTLLRLQQKLDHIIDRAVHQRKRDFEVYRNELERNIARQFDMALQIEKMNLRDEAKWRADERHKKQKEAEEIAQSIGTRRVNEYEMRRERDAERYERLRAIRSDEVRYVNEMRKNAETEAFRQIEKLSAKSIVGDVKKRDCEQATCRDIVERLRLYQGAEFLYNDGVREGKQ